jgi:predicted phosphoribosyltransferase
MDYVTAFFDEGTIQAAMGALLIKILDGGVKRALTSLATTTATRAAPVLTSAAARGGGAAANAAARALSAPVSLLSIWQEGGMSQDEEDAKILASMESRTSRREVARKIMKRTGVSEFDAEAFINRTEAEFNIEKEGVWSNAATQGNTLAEIRDILKVQLSLMNQSVILVPAQTGD